MVYVLDMLVSVLMYAHWVCISVGVLVYGELQNILEEKHMVPENEEATYVYRGVCI